MAVFTVHESPNPPADRVDRAAGLLFVKDGFGWTAAIFGPLALALQRNWVAVSAWGVGASLVLGALYLVGASPAAILIAAFAINLFLGFESAELERDNLEARGWTTLGTVSGSNLAECERRFYEEWLPSQPVLSYHVGAGEPPAMAFASPTPPAPMPPAPARRSGLLASLGHALRRSR